MEVAQKIWRRSLDLQPKKLFEAFDISYKETREKSRNAVLETANVARAALNSEEERTAEEARKEEEVRKAEEEAQKAEEARKVEEARAAEEERKLAQQRAAEAQAAAAPKTVPPATGPWRWQGAGGHNDGGQVAMGKKGKGLQQEACGQ